MSRSLPSVFATLFFLVLLTRYHDAFQVRSASFRSSGKKNVNVLSVTKLLEDQLANIDSRYNLDQLSQFGRRRAPSFTEATINLEPASYPSDTAMTIFVIDMSMPGCFNRMEAVKGVCSTLLPKEKVAVVACYRGSAELKVAPTSSLMQCIRGMAHLQKSVMGNLAAGLNIAIATAEQEFYTKNTAAITIMILADGKAHGLKSGSSGSDCDNNTADLCNIELHTAASEVTYKSEELSKHGCTIQSIVVDTMDSEFGTMESSPEGSALAMMTGSHYFHAPELNRNSLNTILQRAKNWKQ